MMGNGDSVGMPWKSTLMVSPGGDGGNYILDSALVTSGNDTLPFRLIVEEANIFNQRPHVLLTVYKKANYAIHIAVTSTEGTVHVWNVADLETVQATWVPNLPKATITTIQTVTMPAA